jgi:lysophospholipase L1-like esterase
MVDLGLGLAGAIPAPYAPAASAPGASPFEERDGIASIREEWTSKGTMYEFIEGEAAGQFFLELGFRPSSFAVVKSPETLRVFALGASTTFGLRVGRDEAYPARIEQRLQASLGDTRRAEVINLGCPGCSSTHVAGLIRVVLDYDPDLLLVYTGENEMLRLDMEAAPRSVLAKAREAVIEASSIAKWMDHGLGTRTRAPAARTATADDLTAGRIEVYSAEGISGRIHPLPSDAALEQAGARFFDKLEFMVEAARSAAVPLIFIHPVHNPFWQPGGSGLPADFADTSAVVDRVDLALAAAGRGEILAARAMLERTTDEAPTFAEAWYHLGRAEIALGRVDEGRAMLRVARDRDAWTHRMTSPLEDRLADVARSRDVPLVDPRNRFESVRTQEEVDRLFLDHVHPTVEGHRVIADALWPAVRATLPAYAEVSSERATSR